MPWKRNVLVVANVTAPSDDVVRALKALAEHTPSEFTLVVPATLSGGGREAAHSSLQDALDRFRDAGVEADGQVGDADPCVAVSEIWDPKRFDEIVVCTLPLGSSKWLHAGLPERIFKLTGAPIRHVVSRPRPPEAEPEPAPPPHESLPPLLAPFTVLGHTEDRVHLKEQSHRL